MARSKEREAAQGVVVPMRLTGQPYLGLARLWARAFRARTDQTVRELPPLLAASELAMDLAEEALREAFDSEDAPTAISDLKEKFHKVLGTPRSERDALIVTSYCSKTINKPLSAK